MSRARHKMRGNEKLRSNGGRTDEATIYAGADSNVMKSAQERKRGGRLVNLLGEGAQAQARSDRPSRGTKKYAYGGSAAYAKGGRTSHGDVAEDKAMMKSMLKPEAFKARGRKRGGAIGADRMPLTTAAKVTDAPVKKAMDE